MHTTRRHPSIFSGDRGKKRKNAERSGNGSSKKFLFAMIRERFRQILAPLWTESGRNKKRMEKT